MSSFAQVVEVDVDVFLIERLSKKKRLGRIVLYGGIDPKQ